MFKIFELKKNIELNSKNIELKSKNIEINAKSIKNKNEEEINNEELMERIKIITKENNINQEKIKSLNEKLSKMVKLLTEKENELLSLKGKDENFVTDGMLHLNRLKGLQERHMKNVSDQLSFLEKILKR